MVTMKLPPIKVGVSGYNKVMIDIDPRKEEAFRTMVKLWSDYDNYYTKVFLPMWGVVDGDVREYSDEQLNKLRSILKGDQHPFFE